VGDAPGTGHRWRLPPIPVHRVGGVYSQELVPGAICRSMRLIVGSEDSEHVSASFGDRPYADSSVSFDRNLVAVRIDVAIRPFTGSYDALWLVECFPRFGTQLQHLYSDLDGTAEFAPDYDRSLTLRFAGDGIGHISIEGEACPNPATGPWLRFGLPGIDQTYLPAMIDTFAELATTYPEA
jgi:hypothetical protein